MENNKMQKGVIDAKKTRDNNLNAIINCADVVKTTFGHKGASVDVDVGGNSFTVKDGITVAHHICMHSQKARTPDSFGQKHLLQMIFAVEEEVGDGTTTAAIVGGAIAELLRKEKRHRVDILKEINEDAGYIVRRLQEHKMECNEEMLRKVVSTCINMDNKDVIDATIESIEYDKDGVILYRTGDKFYFDKTNKFTYFHAPMMSIYEKEAGNLKKLDNPLILIYPETVSKISVVTDAYDLCEEEDKNGKKKRRPLVIFTAGTQSEVKSKVQELGDVYIVNIVPRIGTMHAMFFDAVRVKTNAKTEFKERKIKREDLGEAKSIELHPNGIVLEGEKFKGAASEDLELYLGRIKEQIEEDKQKGQKDEMKLSILGFLTEKLGTFYMKAQQQGQAQKYTFLLKDALGAGRTAKESGVIEGACVPLFKIGKSMDKKSILGQAIQEPLEVLLKTCLNDENRNTVKQKIINAEKGYTFDIKTGEIGKCEDNGVCESIQTSESVVKKCAEFIDIITGISHSIIV